MVGPLSDAVAAMLSPEALAFGAAMLQRELNPTRERLLARRAERQAELDAGNRPDFLPSVVW